MYEFWYGYIKPKYQNNAEPCYMDADSFIIHIKTFFNMKVFMKILQMMLKDAQTQQSIVKMIKDHFQEV